MGINKIFSDLYMITYGPANIYLIITENDEVILIDTGYSKFGNKILKAINKTGINPGQIKHILLTHSHPDHVGNLAKIKEISNAPVYTHPAGASIIKEGKVMPDIVPTPGFMNGLVFRLLIGNKPGYFDPVDIDQEINHNDVLSFCDGIKAMHTPGHSADHLIYFWPKHGGVLFIGDLAGNMGELNYMLGYNNLELAKKNLKEISKIDFDVACFGHGKIIKGSASEKFKKKWGEV